MSNKKTYCIAKIYRTYVEDTDKSFETYGGAFDYDKQLVKEYTSIVSILVYSLQGTAIVLKRKHLLK
jgi:hypothetical protein